MPMGNFGSWITSENWSPVYQTNDVDFKALSLQNLLRSNYEAHFPVKKNLKYALPINLTLLRLLKN